MAKKLSQEIMELATKISRMSDKNKKASKVRGDFVGSIDGFLVPNKAAEKKKVTKKAKKAVTKKATAKKVTKKVTAKKRARKA